MVYRTRESAFQYGYLLKIWDVQHVHRCVPRVCCHSCRYSNVQTSTLCPYVGQCEVSVYLNVCWCLHKNREIVSVCHHRGFSCPLYNSVAREISLQHIYQRIQNQSEQYHAHWTALSHGTLYGKGPCNVAFNLYRREGLIIRRLNECYEFRAKP